MCMLLKDAAGCRICPDLCIDECTGKEKLWLSLIVSLCVGMLFFNIVPVMTPLDSTVMNVILCLAGGAHV